MDYLVSIICSAVPAALHILSLCLKSSFGLSLLLTLTMSTIVLLVLSGLNVKSILIATEGSWRRKKVETWQTVCVCV